MRRIMSYMACLALPFFSPTFTLQWHDFRETVIEHKMYVLFVSTTFVGYIFHSKKNLAGHFRNSYIGLHVKYASFLLDFSENLEIFDKILKYQIS